MSKNQNTPTFNNPELEKAVTDSSKPFDSYLNSLDKISQDIKALESFIISKGINKDFAGYILEINPKKSENIEWSLDESSGKHRLNYAIYKRFPASADENNCHVPGYEELEKKIPLIEAPSNIRLKAAEYLPRFVKSFAKRVEELKEISVPTNQDQNKDQNQDQNKDQNKDQNQDQNKNQDQNQNQK